MTGFPDRVFIRDIRGGTINYDGQVAVARRPNARPKLAASDAAKLAAPARRHPLQLHLLSLLRTGSDPGERYSIRYRHRSAAFIGGNGPTGREYHTVSILPFTERYNFNLLGHYSFSDAAELFVEAKWNRVNALGNNAGPSFIQSTSTVSSIGDFRERPRLDDPFLSTADRTTLANAILASGCNTEISVVCPAAGNLTAAQQAQVAAGTYRFLVARNLLDVGLRDEHFSRDTYRGVVGLRGMFSTDWSYEISANYGKFREKITTDGFIDRQRFSLAMDAGRNPVTGQIQCRSQFDPAAAVALQRTTAPDVAVAAQNAARLAADIAACVPYNPFGTTNNAASVAYFAREFSNRSGFEPACPVGIRGGRFEPGVRAAGRSDLVRAGCGISREKAFYEQDPFVTAGFTNGVVIPSFEPDPFKVKEAYGELQVPILKDVPFFEELTLSGAARVAHYQGGTGTVWSYNAGGDWAPIRDIRFRGNYSRAVRAPNVSETAFPLVPNFAPGFNDPCHPNQINSGTSTRAANCATALGPLLGSLSNISPSLGIVSG